MVHFGDFLKAWSLRSNSVTRQVNFNRTKIGGNTKIQKFKCDILSNFQKISAGLVFVPKIRPLKKIIWRTPKFEAFMPVWLYRTAATTTFQVQKSVKMYDKTIHNMWPSIQFRTIGLHRLNSWRCSTDSFFSKLVWEMLIYESDASLNKSCFIMAEVHCKNRN